MITIGSSSSRPDESAGPDAAEVAEKSPRRIPLAAIPVILAVGLLVAAGYVGNRIWAARPHATAVAGAITASAQQVLGSGPATLTPAVSSKPVSTSAGLPMPAATTTSTVNKQPAREAEIPTPIEMLGAEQATRNDNLDLIAPQHGERYLQIAAISVRYSQKFLA